MVGTDARNWGSELVVRILVLYFRLGRFSFIFFTKKNTGQNPGQNTGQFFGAPFGAVFLQFSGAPFGAFSPSGPPWSPSVFLQSLSVPSVPLRWACKPNGLQNKFKFKKKIAPNSFCSRGDARKAKSNRQAGEGAGSRHAGGG